MNNSKLLCLLGLLLVIFSVTNATSSVDENLISYFKERNDTTPAQKICDKDIFYYITGNYTNSLLMYLSSGKGPQEVGNYDSCQDITNAHYCVLTYTLYVTNTSGVPVKTGLCVPASCGNAELTGLEKDIVLRLFPSLNVTEGYDVACALKTAEDIRGDTGAIVVLGVIAFLVLLAFLGLILEYIQIRNRKIRKVIAAREGAPDVEGLPHGSQKMMDINGDAKKEKKPPLIVGILMCWSPITNLKKLVVETSVPHLASLNGLRAFSMLWVIMAHGVYWAFISCGYDNILHVNANVVPTWGASLILNGPLSVDSFFYMSGFLVAYIAMKEMYKRGRLNLVLYYFHRIWRLSPPYLMAMFVLWKLLPYMGGGPWWSMVDGYVSRKECDTYWWTNIIFINNFYPVHYNDQCMGWSWYLANDMQMYVISPIFLYAFYKSKLLGVLLVDVCLVASLLTRGILAYNEGFTPDVTDLNALGQKYQDMLYDKFYTRIPAYFAGVLGAFLLLHVEQRKNKRLGWVPWTLVWIVAGVLMYFPLFGTVGLYQSNGKSWGIIEKVLYEAFYHFSWATGLAMLMHMFYIGHGYLVRKVFEWHIWSILARLTFSAYLYHPIIMSVVFFGASNFFHYSALTVTVHFFAFAIGSYFVSLMSFLLIERPMMNLEKFLIPGRH